VWQRVPLVHLPNVSLSFWQVALFCTEGSVIGEGSSATEDTEDTEGDVGVAVGIGWVCA
jgi:hypothetical protein